MTESLYDYERTGPDLNLHECLVKGPDKPVRLDLNIKRFKRKPVEERPAVIQELETIEDKILPEPASDADSKF